MPDTRYRFYHPISVRFADTDAQGHVFFANYFVYFDEALGAYMRAIGFPWQKLQEMGFDVYYVDAAAQFKGGARYEEVLHVHAGVKEIGNTSFTLACAIYRPDGEGPLTTGHITSVVVDVASGVPTRVPQELREAVAAYEGGT